MEEDIEQHSDISERRQEEVPALCLCPTYTTSKITAILPVTHFVWTGDLRAFFPSFIVSVVAAVSHCRAAQSIKTHLK